MGGFVVIALADGGIDPGDGGWIGRRKCWGCL
jgi:hypothetical protein